MNPSMFRFERNIRVVNVICRRDDGKILGLQHFERHALELPGGKREGDETVLDTADREMMEETGIKICCLSRDVFIDVGDKGTLHATIFCEPIGEDAIRELAPTKEGQPVWVDPEDFQRGNFWDYNRRAFEFFGIDVRTDAWAV